MKPTVNLVIEQNELKIIVKHSGIYTETFHISLDVLKKHLKAYEERQYVRPGNLGMPQEH